MNQNVVYAMEKAVAQLSNYHGLLEEPEIPMSSFKLAINNSAETVVEVANGPIERVYLKRLVRQDETGIWSVVGYDPR